MTAVLKVPGKLGANSVHPVFSGTSQFHEGDGETKAGRRGNGSLDLAHG